MFFVFHVLALCSCSHSLVPPPLEGESRASYAPSSQTSPSPSSALPTSVISASCRVNSTGGGAGTLGSRRLNGARFASVHFFVLLLFRMRTYLSLSIVFFYSSDFVVEVFCFGKQNCRGLEPRIPCAPSDSLPECRHFTTCFPLHYKLDITYINTLCDR